MSWGSDRGGGLLARPCTACWVKQQFPLHGMLVSGSSAGSADRGAEGAAVASSALSVPFCMRGSSGPPAQGTPLAQLHIRRLCITFLCPPWARCPAACRAAMRRLDEENAEFTQVYGQEARQHKQVGWTLGGLDLGPCPGL